MIEFCVGLLCGSFIGVAVGYYLGLTLALERQPLAQPLGVAADLVRENSYLRTRVAVLEAAQVANDDARTERSRADAARPAAAADSLG